MLSDLYWLIIPGSILLLGRTKRGKFSALLLINKKLIRCSRLADGVFVLSVCVQCFMTPVFMRADIQLDTEMSPNKQQAFILQNLTSHLFHWKGLNTNIFQYIYTHQGWMHLHFWQLFWSLIIKMMLWIYSLWHWLICIIKKMLLWHKTS